jgi:hypothetical protein
MGEDFPHQARQSRAIQVAGMNPVAALRRRDAGRCRIERYLGAVDSKPQMEMRENMLDQSRHLAPLRL